MFIFYAGKKRQGTAQIQKKQSEHFKSQYRIHLQTLLFMYQVTVVLPIITENFRKKDQKIRICQICMMT